MLAGEARDAPTRYVTLGEFDGVCSLTSPHLVSRQQSACRQVRAVPSCAPVPAAPSLEHGPGTSPAPTQPAGAAPGVTHPIFLGAGTSTTGGPAAQCPKFSGGSGAPRQRPHLPPAGKQDASLRDCNSSRNNVTPKSSHLGQDSGVSPKMLGLSARCREQSQAGALSREGPPAPPGNPQLKAAQRAKCPSASTVCNGAGCHSAGTASVQLCRVCFCQRDGCAKRPSAGTVCNGAGCASASLVSVHGAPPPAR